MKIKLNKYIFYYIILVFISIFFYLNVNLFKSFFGNFRDYIKLFNLQKQNIVSFSGYDINYNVGFSSVDLSNLYLLNNNFTGAKEFLYETNEYSYKELYNLGNIYLLQAYQTFFSNKTGYIDETKQSLSFYETALENIPSYKNKTNILENLNLSQNFLKFLYIYNCDNLFISMIEKTNKLIKLFPVVIKVLQSQQSALNKWLEYDDLRSCIQSFKSEADENISILYENKDFFYDVDKGLKTALKNFQGNEISCYQQSPAIKSKYKDSINSSYDYYTKFLKKQQDLLKIFTKANKQQIEQLCDSREDIANQQNKENQEMDDNFDKLKDLTQKPQQQEKKPEEGEDQEKKESSEEEKQEKNKRYSDELESLDNQNKDLIEQIQRNKTQGNYNPLEYIQELFKEFYANDEDFKEGKKNNEVGK